MLHEWYDKNYSRYDGMSVFWSFKSKGSKLLQDFPSKKFDIFQDEKNSV